MSFVIDLRSEFQDIIKTGDAARRKAFEEAFTPEWVRKQCMHLVERRETHIMLSRADIDGGKFAALYPHTETFLQEVAKLLTTKYNLTAEVVMERECYEGSAFFLKISWETSTPGID